MKKLKQIAINGVIYELPSGAGTAPAVSDAVVITQDFVNKQSGMLLENGKRYHFAEAIDLKGKTILCQTTVLRFAPGAKLSNGALVVNDTAIEAMPVRIFDDNMKIGGIWKCDIWPEWFGAVGDGHADDAQAINAAILAAGHAPVVCNAEKYLVKSTVVVAESLLNEYAQEFYEYAYLQHSGNDKYESRQTLIFKHDIIGDHSLAAPVILFGSGYSRLEVGGAIVVRNNTDKAIGLQTSTSTTVAALATSTESTQQTINIGSVVHAYDSYTYVKITADTIASRGLGKGVGVHLSGTSSKVHIKQIFGFNKGVQLHFFNNGLLDVGGTYNVHEFYMGKPSEWPYSGLSVSRSKLIIRTVKGPHHADFGDWSWVKSAPQSAIFCIDGTCEVAMNDFVYTNDNVGAAEISHPHKHTILVKTNQPSGHTGNYFDIRLTYGLHSSRKFLCYDNKKFDTNRMPNSDIVDFKVSCYLDDIDIKEAFNVKVRNVLIPHAEHPKGSYRFFGKPNEFLLDEVLYTNAGAPRFVAGQPTIRILRPNPQMLGHIHVMTEAPSNGEEGKIYIVNNSATNITAGGLTKYAVYGWCAGTFGLLGHYIDTFGLVK